MRVDDTFSASTDLRSGQINRTQDPQLEPQQRVRRDESGSDAVDVSSLGNQISQHLATESPQEIDRVEQTRQAVAAGTFNVPALELADSLIDSALIENSIEQQLEPTAQEATP